MRTSIALLSAFASIAIAAPTVDTTYAYTGPAVPVGDFVDPTINGNGKGFVRLTEPPAVTPSSAKPTNNINVISLAYIPGGMNVHFQTPFGIGGTPQVVYGTSAEKLSMKANGTTKTYDRTPSCSQISNITQCSQFFYDVPLTGLKAGKEYYYMIPGGNGTTPSEVLSFKTARAAGQAGEFSVVLINDMGYTNAQGTHKQILKSISDGASHVWHGGDISYADDWYEGFLVCDLTNDADSWPVCFNGSSSTLPSGLTPEYNVSLPAGEVPEQGGPYGGDISVIYETNWDLWQSWMNAITKKVPHMVTPGNHEAACAEFDGAGPAGANVLAAYLNNNEANSSAPDSELTYYSCPPSQRNYTAYQNRFTMSGEKTGGVSNFWYSYDYGLAHFISFDGETDYPSSPEYPFVADLTGNETHPLENQTYITDSGPFGYINGSYKVAANYEQYQWLKADLAKVNRTKTPWVFAMSHRPMYSSGVSSYQAHMRAAFESLLIEGGVDAYISGHIHWYERTFPLGVNATIDTAAIVNNNTFLTKPTSMLHIINGQAGNIESHSFLEDGETVLNITAHLNTNTFGFTKLTVFNESMAKFEFIEGTNGTIGDKVTLIKA